MNQQIHDALKELEQENENEVTTADGYTVRCCYDGCEPLELLRDGQPILVLAPTAHGRRVSYSHVRSHADQEAALTVLEYGGMRA